MSTLTCPFSVVQSAFHCDMGVFVAWGGMSGQEARGGILISRGKKRLS